MLKNNNCIGRASRNTSVPRARRPDPNYMPPQLQAWLDNADYAKAHKYTSGKLSRGSRAAMFYAVITAFCLRKTGKQADSLDILNDFKSQKPSDSQTATYLVAIYNHLGRHGEATVTLEYVLSLFPNQRSLSEELFYSYVREGKLLKQQN